MLKPPLPLLFPSPALLAAVGRFQAELAESVVARDGSLQERLATDR